MRKSVTALALLGLSALTLTSPASAWDYPGHRIVGAIADIVLQKHHPAVYARVSELLDLKFGDVVDKRTLNEVAVFPDCAKNEKEYCGRPASPEEVDYVLRNIVHKSFHFTNSPLQQKTYLAGGVGTLESDIVQMIGHTVTQLRGKRPYFKRDVKLTNTEAVWLLAHLVGDIHQPLHVGQIYYDTTCEKPIDPNASRTIEFVSTYGGNLIKVASGSTLPNLHLHWDSGTVKKAMQDDGAGSDEMEFAKKLATSPPASWQTDGDPETWAEKWVAEIMPIANEAHQRLSIRHDKSADRKPVFPSATISCGWLVDLSPDYEQWAAQQAREQVRKAGFRLAALLVAIFPDK